MGESVTSLNIENADRWHQRLLGLMFRSALAPGQALLLSPCASVHTAFMRFASKRPAIPY